MATRTSAPATFTKLVVDDLDAMANYYCSVFGLHRGTRVRFEDGVAGEPLDEISLVIEAGSPFGPLTLMKYEQRPAPPNGEVILGFTTDDLSAMLERVLRAGGELCGEVKDIPEHGIRVAFARDPEGHLSELVEMQT